MEFFFSYIISYLLSFVGFLLGKSTDYELKELEDKIVFFSKLSIILSIVLFSYYCLLQEKLLQVVVILTIGICSIVVSSQALRTTFTMVLLAGSTYITLETKELIVLCSTILFISSLVFDNSIKKFSLKEEGINSIFYVILYFLFSYVFSL